MPGNGEMPDVTGPFGGIIGGAYALGCVSGWGFAMWQMNARIAEHKTEIADLKTQVATLNAFMMRGMQRQLDQVHDSTVRMIDRGVIVPPLGEGG